MQGSQHDIIRREFGRQAAHFGEQGLTLSNQDYLRWMVDQLGLQPHLEVLDVAAGTGHLSRAIAPRVTRVTALDLTPEMVAQGRREAAQQGLSSVVFEQGRRKLCLIPVLPLISWSRVSHCITLPTRAARSKRWCASAATAARWPLSIWPPLLIRRWQRHTTAWNACVIRRMHGPYPPMNCNG
jgi:SAM-dependent methyltransferase